MFYEQTVETGKRRAAERENGTVCAKGYELDSHRQHTVIVCVCLLRQRGSRTGVFFSNHSAAERKSVAGKLQQTELEKSRGLGVGGAG